MRSTVYAMAAVLALAGCHFNKPAQDAENSDDTESSSDDTKSGASHSNEGLAQSNELDKLNKAPETPKAEKATITDDTDKKDVACSGMNIPDLLSALSQAACERPANAPPPKLQASKDVVDVTATADSSQIAPNGTAQIRVVFKNKTKEKLPLDFTVDPDPRFSFELYTFKGARADKPAGNEPSLPSEASDNAPPEPHQARVVLFPNGTATVVLPWHAVKYKWASKERAKGAIAGRGYPRDPAGPLGKGKYVLRVVTPLLNVDESTDHEISQPRAHFEISGSPVPDAPPPAPVAEKKATPAPAPAASSSESVESKFLKATGGSDTSDKKTDKSNKGDKADKADKADKKK